MDTFVILVSILGLTGVVTTGIAAACVPTLPALVLTVAWLRPQDWAREPARVPEALRRAA